MYVLFCQIVLMSTELTVPVVTTTNAQVATRAKFWVTKPPVLHVEVSKNTNICCVLRKCKYPSCGQVCAFVKICVPLKRGLGAAYLC